MNNNTICAIVGPTTENSVKSVIGQCETFHLTHEKQQWPYVVCDDSVNVYKTAIKFAKSKKKDYLYIMSGFSVLNKDCIKKIMNEEPSEYASIFSDYRIFDSDAPHNKMVMEAHISFNYYEILKLTQNIKNIFINLNNVIEDDYINPYHLILANSYDKISFHIPEPLYSIPYTEYIDKNNDLINNIKANYAKLYLQR